MYEVEENLDMRNKKVEMLVDAPMATNMNPAIQSLSRSFCMLICGKSGSGKTNFLTNLLKTGVVNGQRKGLKKQFENIIVCSPSIASLKTNIFKNLDDSKMFTEFNEEFIDYLIEFCHEEKEDGNNTLVILDDVGSELRRKAIVEKKFLQLIYNKRHLGLSIICTVQKYNNSPVGARSNMTHLVLFRPTNMKELQTVHEEVIPIEKNKLNDFIDFVFDKKYNFLMVDMSLHLSPTFVFYKNFDKILM